METLKTTRAEKIREELSYTNEQAIFIDAFDEALVGIDLVDYVAVYDVDKCVAILMITSEMTHEEAEEYFDQNIISNYMTEYSPRFVKQF